MELEGVIILHMYALQTALSVPVNAGRDSDVEVGIASSDLQV